MAAAAHPPSAPAADPAPRWNGLPIVVMSGGWLGPLAMFWLSAWGPVRPYGAEGALSPRPLPYTLALAVCVAAWWLPAGWFRPRAREVDGRLYRALGVPAFRRLVPDGDWVNRVRRRRDPGFRVVPDRRAAAAFVRRTQESERGHTVLLLMGAVSSAYAWHRLARMGRVPGRRQRAGEPVSHPASALYARPAAPPARAPVRASSHSPRRMNPPLEVLNFSTAPDPS